MADVRPAHREHCVPAAALRNPGKEHIMSRHKLIALASLVLGAAMLSPASALAKPQCPVPARVGAQGTCRPLLTGGTATVRLNTRTLQFTAEGTGVGTLAGSGRTVFYNGQATPIGFTP